MGSSTPTTDTPTAKSLKVTADALIVDLRDGRTVSVPLGWYPRLAEATPRERRRWELIGGGIGVHWPAIDEDISIAALLDGHASRESAASLRQWRMSRRRPARVRRTPTSRNGR